MKGNITFMIIKPNAIRKGNMIPILCRIHEAGFSVSAMKYLQLTREQAEGFYAEHKGTEYFAPLITFMLSSPILAAVLKKENAVASFRKLIGPTDPEKAPQGTIRAEFGDTLRENAIHGSDADDKAEREAAFFFDDKERL